MSAEAPLVPKEDQFIAGTLVELEKVKGFLRYEWVRWLLPWMWAGLGFYCQSVGLHWATYGYIHKYGMQEKAAPNDVLYDSIEEGLGYHKVDMSTIDKIAAFFPAFFCFLSFMVAVQDYFPCWRSNAVDVSIRSVTRRKVMLVWTKVMTSAGFLFMCKGALGAMTIVPDSSGWVICKDRLKSTGLVWMREEHTFWDMLSVDFDWVIKYHTPLRYCSDMMFSGHTFVVTLFALGCYEMMRIFRNHDLLPGGKNIFTKCIRSRKELVKTMVLFLFGCATVAEQAVEIWVVERSHFHYSMDVFMAIILTFLVYTNGVIAVFAKQWTAFGLNVKYWNDRRTIHNMQDLQEKSLVHPEWVLFNSRGDIFIPPCCVPFCMLSGREHIYSDKGIKDLIVAYEGKNKKGHPGTSHVQPSNLREYLQQTMNLDEGVSKADLKKSIRQSVMWQP